MAKYISKNIKPVFAIFLLLAAQNRVAAQLLWRAVSANAVDTVMLFGTMHFEEGQFFTSSPVLTSAASQASCVVLETEMNPQISESVMMYAKLPDTIKISDRLSAEEIHILDSLLSLMGPLNTEMLNGFKPNFITVQLAMLGLMNGDSLNTPSEPLDRKIQQFALEKKKAIKYLETDAFQLEMLLDRQPIDMQFAMLKSTLKVASGRTYDSSKLWMNQMPEIYRRQQLDSLQKLIELTSNNSPEEQYFYHSLLTERNLTWMKSIMEYCQQGEKPFIAVGAGHLPGNAGLIQLLRNQGFTVSPMPF